MPMKLTTRSLWAAAGAVAITAGSASAHVILNEPNGGETLTVGSTVTIEWVINVSHNLQNWDLWYSTAGSVGPWTIIATDLAPGSASAGSIHTYGWVVPDVPDDSVWVRVRMDNAVTDYYDVSNGSFSIVAAVCLADLTTQGAGVGDPNYGVPDGLVTGADLQYFVNAWIVQDLAIADVTTQGAGIGDPGFGVPDGVVTGADIQFYVNAWVVGCP